MLPYQYLSLKFQKQYGLLRISYSLKRQDEDHDNRIKRRKLEKARMITVSCLLVREKCILGFAVILTFSFLRFRDLEIALQYSRSLLTGSRRASMQIEFDS